MVLDVTDQGTGLDGGEGLLEDLDVLHMLLDVPAHWPRQLPRGNKNAKHRTTRQNPGVLVFLKKGVVSSKGRPCLVAPSQPQNISSGL